MVRIETSFAEQLLEQLLLVCRVTRAYYDQHIWVGFSGAEDILYEPTSTHTAKLGVHNSIIHIEVGFEFEGK